MGIKNVLIEGGSGTGKTTVAEELRRRGHDVVHGDRVLAYIGDPETGVTLDVPPDGADRIAWEYAHWIWHVDRVQAIASDRNHPVTFFCGGSRNFHKFLEIFDLVFVLDIDIETLQRRLDGRSGEWGSKPDERALVLRYHGTDTNLPDGIRLETNDTVQNTVDEILTRLGEAFR